MLCAGSDELQMALSDWKPQTLANLAEPRRRQPKHPGSEARGDDIIGLATTNDI